MHAAVLYVPNASLTIIIQIDKGSGIWPRLFPLISGLSVEISENPAKRFAYFHRFSLMW